jgi:hypothetical protein
MKIQYTALYRFIKAKIQYKEIKLVYKKPEV